MTRPSIVLVISADPRVAGAFRGAANDQDVLLEAQDLAQGLAIAIEERPDLIVAGPMADPAAMLSLCRVIRSAADESLSSVAVISPAPDPEFAEAAADAGADAQLSIPIDRAEARAALHWAVRLRAVRETGRAGVLAMDRIEQQKQKCLEEVIAMLEHVIDIAIPGARARAARNVARAARLAERFEIPETMRRDLELAVRLNEIGRVASGATPGTTLHSAPSIDHWQYTQSSRAILEHVQALEEVGDLIAHLYENWDGTGHPEHRLRGQIPLRSRIMRALADLEVGGERGTAAALERLTELAGTRYDPMVVAQLRELIAAESGEEWTGRTMLPVDALEIGMTLAEDLYSSSGMKLLCRDTVLTSTALEAILRRHRAEPILHAVAVRPAAA